jgi:hypothetical protein
MHEGVLISSPIDASPVIRKNAETTSQWDKAKEAARIYRGQDKIMDRFYHGVAIPAFPGKLPTPIIAIEPLDIRVLAQYRVVPDGYGLPYKLTMNERFYRQSTDEERQAMGLEAQAYLWMWGEWAKWETVTHEGAHHWQQLRGKDPYKPGKKITHNREFVDKLESLGIYSTLGHGAHYKQADLQGPFGILMQEWGVKRPEVPDEAVPPKIDWFKFFYGAEKPKGKSSLFKWQCAVCGMAIRIGLKGDIHVSHDDDGGKFVRAQ